MKLNVKYIDSDIILSNDYIFSVEINNKGLFYRFINDLNNIANGNMIEDIYLYKDLNEVNIANRISVIIDYFNIDFNSKKVLAFINNLIVGSINEKDILSINQYYNKILDIILDNTDDINISLEVNDEFDIQNIIKLFKITVKNKDNILDKITLFIDLEKELSINEFIVLVNIKQYLTKEELIELYKYAIYNQIKLLLVDDHSLVRQGIKQILELEEDLEVIGQASDGEEAIKKAQELKPDIILLDINMPKLNGINTLRKLKDIDTTTKVIMLTFYEDREYIFETLNLGVNGYILKDAESESLIKAIRDVYNGSSYIHPSIAMEVIKKTENKDNHGEEKSKLTKREYEVLILIAEGLNNRKIADRLYISEKTVKNHVSNIFKKIKVNDRTQAAIYAYRHNIKKI